VRDADAVADVSAIVLILLDERLLRHLAAATIDAHTHGKHSKGCLAMATADSAAVWTVTHRSALMLGLWRPVLSMMIAKASRYAASMLGRNGFSAQLADDTVAKALIIRSTCCASPAVTIE